MLVTLVIALMLFTNNYWNIAIELPDDGKEKEMALYHCPQHSTG